MKNLIKTFSLVGTVLIMSSVTFAELAASKGNSDSGKPAAPGENSGCPAKPKVDASKAKTCPQSLGEIPLALESQVEYEVEAYVPETESYELIGVKMPDEGTIPVTLEAMAKSDGIIVGAKDNKEKMAILKKGLTSPCDVLKKRIKLKNIQTLSDNDLKARKGCLRK